MPLAVAALFGNREGRSGVTVVIFLGGDGYSVDSSSWWIFLFMQHGNFISWWLFNVHNLCIQLGCYQDDGFFWLILLVNVDFLCKSYTTNLLGF